MSNAVVWCSVCFCLFTSSSNGNIVYAKLKGGGIEETERGETEKYPVAPIEDSYQRSHLFISSVNNWQSEKYTPSSIFLSDPAFFLICSGLHKTVFIFSVCVLNLFELGYKTQ